MSDQFDPAKDETNRLKHGLPLAFGNEVFGDTSHIVERSFRSVDREERFKVIGRVGEKFYTAVFVWREGLPRFISVRRSNSVEERRYRDSG